MVHIRETQTIRVFHFVGARWWKAGQDADTITLIKW